MDVPGAIVGIRSATLDMINKWAKVQDPIPLGARELINRLFREYKSVEPMLTEFNQPCESYFCRNGTTRIRLGPLDAGTTFGEARVSLTHKYILVETHAAVPRATTDDEWRVDHNNVTVRTTHATYCIDLEPVKSSFEEGQPLYRLKNGMVCNNCLATCSKLFLYKYRGYGHNHVCESCYGPTCLSDDGGFENTCIAFREKDEVGHELRYLNQTPENTGYTMDNVYY